jgi:hypothetical protein
LTSFTSIFTAKLCGYTSCFVVAAVVVACLLVLYSLKQFGILSLQVAVWYPATAAWQQPPSLVSQWQFGILPLQQGNSRRVDPATAFCK